MQTFVSMMMNIETIIQSGSMINCFSNLQPTVAGPQRGVQHSRKELVRKQIRRACRQSCNKRQ
jgi:hypothetical protein